jgi:hypothetical protein
MAITTVDADLSRDRELLIDTLSRFLTPLADVQRFDWLYKNNPEGVARTWLATDTETGRVVGTAAAFPRRCYLGQSKISAWVFGDFCFDAQYRSLGPALQLQRACLRVLESDSAVFSYDFPSASMLAVYKRLGFQVTMTMVRLARLLRVDRKVRNVINIPAAEQVISTAGNTLLRLVSANIVPDRSVELHRHQGSCGEEFTMLAEEQRGRNGMCIQRSAEYLNWRYVNNPLTQHKFLTARQHGILKGYAVWTQAGNDAFVVDLFGENNPAIVKGLLSEVVSYLTERGVMTLSVWLNDSHPWLPWYSEMGFRSRESIPMVCIPGSGIGNLVSLRSAKWFLMQGDRDS